MNDDTAQINVQGCLDADSQSLFGAVPTAPHGHGGNLICTDILFDLLGRIRPQIFCDIGANRGEAGQRARSILPQALVFGFEANPEIYEANRKTNEGLGVNWQNLAVANQDGVIELYIPRKLSRVLRGETIVERRVRERRGTGKSSLLQRDEDAVYHKVEVKATKLDGFLSQHAPEGRVALWIDVEGAASTVLAGAQETLARTDIIFVEVEGFRFWKDQTLGWAVISSLQGLGFVPILRDREYSDAQFNVICVRSSIVDGVLRDHIAGLLNKSTRSEIPLRSGTQGVRQSNIPVLVPCFNNPTYCSQMLGQLRSLGFTDITFVDNASTSEVMSDWLGSVSPSEARIERLSENLGPMNSIFTAERLASLPRHFCVTDPDLRFNPYLPPDFLDAMIETAEKYAVGKVGFALDISNPKLLRDDDFTIGERRYKIWDWEKRFWRRRAGFTSGGDAIFVATVDTTFALYDQKRFKPTHFLRAHRVGGRLTATHLPWLKDIRLGDDETRTYRESQKFSYYLG